MIEMPDAWTILKENSSLVSGDAWEHLNNQVSGSGDSLTLFDGLEVEMADPNFDVEIEDSEVIVEIDTGFEIEIETNDYEVEV